MKKSCQKCHSSFEITDQDVAFYDKVSPVFNGKKYSIPPPTYCPDCRLQRRLSFRNERTLYRRKCDLSGKEIISMYSEDTPFPVYDITVWRSDGWDPLSYGRDFDLTKGARPFFEQFAELLSATPHYNLFIDPSVDINSDYTNCAGWNKNCYLITQSAYNEDCYHGRSMNYCKDCCDCLGAQKCERCYQCIDVNNCYECIYCEQCENCANCCFSSSLRSCSNCIGCHGLVRKEWYFLNEQLDQLEWEKRFSALKNNKAYREEVHKKSEELRRKTPKRALYMVKCEDTVGDYIEECRTSDWVFNSFQLEDCKYCYDLNEGNTRDCMDYSMWGGGELIYESNACGSSAYHLLFCDACWRSPTELIYCALCTPAVKHCFGCVGLQRQEYCILNKQYSKDEYECLVAQIIEKMRIDGEWGEFFPSDISPFTYNETVACEFFPLSKEEAEHAEFRWKNKVNTVPHVEKIMPANTLPENIEDIPDDILDWAIECEKTHKLFKLTAQELKFYKNMNLLLPRAHPDVRHQRRMNRRTPRKLWQKTCDKCRKEIQTTYAPGRPEIVYCEQCYLKEVY